MKKVSKEEIQELKEGTKFIIYNPLTGMKSIEILNEKSIIFNRHCYSKLEFYLIESDEDLKEVGE